MDRFDDSSDVKFEILSRASLKTLATCRMLSKELNRMSYETTFMRFHCERTNTITGYFIESSSRNLKHSTFLSIENPSLNSKIGLDFLPGPAKILCCSYGGLMLCMTCHPYMTGGEYHICKPSTRQFRTIPKPTSDRFTSKIAMIVIGLNPLRFRVVHIFKPDSDPNICLEPEFYDSSRYCCEVFDSDTWVWNRLNDLILPYGESFHPNQEAVSASGGLHWLAFNASTNEKSLLSFYQDKEGWESVPLPESLISKTGPWSSSVRLAKYEGELGLINVKSGTSLVELWVRDSFGQKSWSKRHELDLEASNPAFPAYKADSFYNSDTLLLTGLWEAISYNFKNHKFERFKLGSQYKYPETAFFIQTDNEPIDLK